MFIHVYISQTEILLPIPVSVIKSAYYCVKVNFQNISKACTLRDSIELVLNDPLFKTKLHISLKGSK
jgi:hypothetical protein